MFSLQIQLIYIILIKNNIKIKKKECLMNNNKLKKQKEKKKNNIYYFNKLCLNIFKKISFFENEKK